MTTNTSMPVRGALVAAAVALLAAGGCGPRPTRVHGTVTLDGQPVANGMIQFFPTQGDRPSAGAPITNGTYQADATPGPFRVTVNVPEVVGQRKAYDDLPDSPLIDVHRERLPDRYSRRDKSELTVTLEHGENTADFALTGAKPKK